MKYYIEVEEELGWITKEIDSLPYKIITDFPGSVYTLFYSFDGIQVEVTCIKCNNKWITNIKGILEKDDLEFLENFIRKQKLEKLLNWNI